MASRTGTRCGLRRILRRSQTLRFPIVLALLAALPATADDWKNPPLEWRSPLVGPASDMWELARQQMILDEQRRRLEFDRSLEIQQLKREHRFRMERLQQEQRIESMLRERADRLRQEALRQVIDEKDLRGGNQNQPVSRP